MSIQNKEADTYDLSLLVAFFGLITTSDGWCGDQW